jgi:Na+/melibiose symporter-like transporter
MWGYAIGALGQVLPISFFNTYAFQYYVYTVGLDPLLTSIGIFLGLFVFAVCSPIFGVLVDNRPVGKFGKRRPFIIASIPMLLILMVLAWTPPLCPPDNSYYWPTAIYFWVIAVMLDINQAMFVSTYLSMLAEQCTNDANRVKVASLQGLFFLLATVLSIFIPIILQAQLPDPQNPLWSTPSGAFLVRNLPIVGICFGLVGMLTFLTVFYSTDESFFPKQTGPKPPRSPVHVILKQVFTPFADKNYRNWMGNTFFFNISLRILTIVLMPYLTFVLLLQENQFIGFVGAVIPFAGLGYLLWVRLIKKMGLKKSYGTALQVSIIISFLTAIFIIPMPTGLRLGLGVCILGVAIACLAGGYLFPNPIVSVLIDNAPEELRRRVTDQGKGISGAYFGLFIFTYNIAQAVANLILGFIFTGGNARNPTIIALGLPLAGVILVIAYWFLRRVAINQRKDACPS